MAYEYPNSPLKINDVGIHSPQTLQWDLEDLDADGSGRNQNGLLFRDRVGQKRKINCVWPPLNSGELAQLLQAMQPEFFTLSYPDALTGGVREGTFYVAKKSAPVYKKNADGTWLWERMTANFVER